MKKILKLKIFLLLPFLFSCTEENYVTLPQPNKGQVNIYIEGNITNEQAQAKLDAEIGTITENIYVQNTTQLTAVTIKPVGNIRDIKLENNTALKSLTIQGNGGEMNDLIISPENGTPAHILNSVVINGITEANQFYFRIAPENPNEIAEINCNDLVTLNSRFRSSNTRLIFNDLKYINKIFKSYDTASDQQYRSAIGGEIIMPKLEEVHSCNFGFVSPQNFILPNLKKAYNLSFTTGSQVSGLSIQLPLLYEVNSLVANISNTFTIEMASIQICSDNLKFSKNLTSSKVNDILHQLLGLQQTTNKTIYLNDITNQPPTGQGLIDKQTLINKGYNVLTN